MFRSDFHYHRSRACAVAAIEQHARGAEGLAHILAATASAEGTKGRCYQNHERELFRLMVTHQGELREVYESGMVRRVDQADRLRDKISGKHFEAGWRPGVAGLFEMAANHRETGDPSHEPTLDNL